MSGDRPLPYLALFVGDLLAAAAIWTGEALAVHLLALVKSWAAGPLPEDPARLAGALRIKPRLLAAVWPEIRGQWQAGSGGLRCPWLEVQRERVAEISALRAEAGRRGGKANAKELPKQPPSNGGAIAPPLFEQSAEQNGSLLSPSPSPSSSLSKEVGPPSGGPNSSAESRFGPENRTEAEAIAYANRPECDEVEIVAKFAAWLPENPSQNWRAALATYARGEHFSVRQHAARKARELAAGPAPILEVLRGNGR